jgi:hypothetical protein
VIFVKEDIFWQLFLETGDPVCWLLHHRRGEKKSAR